MKNLFALSSLLILVSCSSENPVLPGDTNTDVQVLMAETLKRITDKLNEPPAIPVEQKPK